MTNLRKRGFGTGTSVLVVAAIGSLVLTGCSKEPEEPVAIAPKKEYVPPPPPAPVVTPIAELMAEMQIDERIVFPESEAPDNDADRRALLSFFDAIVRNDAESLRPMLSLSDRQQLEQIEKSATWQAAVDDIVEVEIRTGVNVTNQACVLAIFAVDLDFQPQLWYYGPSMDSHTFEAASSPPGMMEQLYGDDWIAAWHRILEEEIALANALEEEIAPVQHVLGETSSTQSSIASPNDGPGGPGPNPGSPPGRRKPPNQPRRAPGPGN